MTQRLNVPALKKQWVLEAQCTDCPEEVEQVIKDLWRTYELGNDNYMLRRSVNDFLESFGDELKFEVERWFWGETEEERKGWVLTEVSAKPLIDYLRASNIPDNEEVIIHWWW